MGHRMHWRPSWNYCTYRLISWAFIFGSIVLYASYLCLSPIYCLTHVECFRFFMAANIDFVWSRFEASLQLACDLLSTCLWHAHASLRTGLQLARIMECGLYCITVSGWRQRTPTAATNTSHDRTTGKVLLLKDIHNLRATINERQRDVTSALSEHAASNPDDDVRLLIDDTSTVRQIFIQTAAMKEMFATFPEVVIVKVLDAHQYFRCLI